MRRFLVICILLVAVKAAATEPGIREVRELFFRSGSDKGASQQFYEKLQAADCGGSALLLAYKGVSIIMEAKYSFNPYYKLSYFNEGKHVLEEAVHRAPNDPEIRFLRFSVQTQAPGLLGYSSDKTADKSFLLGSWRSLPDEDLKQRVKHYLVAYGGCSAAERQMLE